MYVCMYELSMLLRFYMYSIVGLLIYRPAYPAYQTTLPAAGLPAVHICIYLVEEVKYVMSHTYAHMHTWDISNH